MHQYPWLRLFGLTGLLLALMLFLTLARPPFRVMSDSTLEALVAAAFLPRNTDVALHELAHQRAVEIATDFSHTGSSTAEVIAWNSG
jgi:hypothetical protein